MKKGRGLKGGEGPRRLINGGINWGSLRVINGGINGLINDWGGSFKGRGLNGNGRGLKRV